MYAKQLKRFYGKEYPAAVVVDRVRLPLQKERRFSRSYYLAKRRMGSEVSRFMDGTASITLTQFQAEWPTWTEGERLDFCENCCWLSGQSDFPDMLRFIVKHGCHDDWSAIALPIASDLPRDEAFKTLLGMLRKAKAGKASNLAQGIAQTKHPKAERTLRKHLQSIWAHKSLWGDDKFINWVAFDATTCIAHLIEIGASPSDFQDQVRQLSQHVCCGNRNSCRNFLSKHYSWLK